MSYLYFLSALSGPVNIHGNAWFYGSSRKLDLTLAVWEKQLESVRVHNRCKVMLLHSLECRDHFQYLSDDWANWKRSQDLDKEEIAAIFVEENSHETTGLISSLNDDLFGILQWIFLFCFGFEMRCDELVSGMRRSNLAPRSVCKGKEHKSIKQGIVNMKVWDNLRETKKHHYD